MHIYKRTQGKYTRLITAIAMLMLGAWGCLSLAKTLHGSGCDVYMSFGIPLVVLLGLAGLLFWLVNRPKSADFLIATESEMKKVSWASRKEVVGSTKVVIVTTFIMAALLFLVDVVFANFFKLIKVTG
ncbi:MAG: preprotein translocase subunit SecE [Phycisphaerae bacterium]|nr:preprotein translocase subunit SecE [Phycisphaerae bacterium]